MYFDRVITVEEEDENNATDEHPAWLKALLRHKKTVWYKRIKPRQWLGYITIAFLLGIGVTIAWNYFDLSFSFTSFNMFGGFGG